MYSVCGSSLLLTKTLVNNVKWEQGYDFPTYIILFIDIISPTIEWYKPVRGESSIL